VAGGERLPGRREKKSLVRLGCGDGCGCGCGCYDGGCGGGTDLGIAALELEPRIAHHVLRWRSARGGNGRERLEGEPREGMEMGRAREWDWCETEWGSV
jgi:hypothetical protein